MESKGGHVVAAFLIAAGSALGGGLIGKGFRDARTADRYVSVRGLAEKIVKADVAIWTLQLSAGGNDLARLQAKIDEDVAGELVRSGVVINDLGGPVYVFTKLNEIKPAMIAEATRNARASAEQFAADSQSRIAGIHRATQGLFQILPRDESQAVAEPSQLEKKVRVVTTMEYLVAD